MAKGTWLKRICGWSAKTKKRSMIPSTPTTQNYSFEKWVDVPWEKRSLLSKLGYVIFMIIMMPMGLAIFCFMLWICAEAVIALIDNLLGWHLDKDFNNFLAGSIIWLWDLPKLIGDSFKSGQLIAWVVAIILLSNRWTRLVIFLTAGTVIGYLIPWAVTPLDPKVQMIAVICAAFALVICSVVSVICIFAPRPQKKNQNRKNPDKDCLHGTTGLRATARGLPLVQPT